MAGLFALALLAADVEQAPLSGWASAYAPGVMDATVEYRFAHDLWWTVPPADWYTVAGYVAVADCRRVGEIATLVDPAGREWRVLIADCAGDDGTPGWMADNGIVAELDAALWARLVERHGRPLAVELRE